MIPLTPFNAKNFLFKVIDTFEEFNENEIKALASQIGIIFEREREILFMNCGWPGARPGGGAANFFFFYFQHCNLS